MKLYLHIGTEKTGSSHLQSIMALNRETLREKGYWFPLAGKREKHLRMGQVSPGNAQALADLIEKRDFEKVRRLLRAHITEASAKNCQKVLLSNELLLLALSTEGKVEEFQRIAQLAGFTEVHYLLIIRDPNDQALSLYKHRAKKGNAVNIEEWPVAHYHYGEGLKEFLKQANNNSLSLICKKYINQGNQLDNLCFKDWLGIAPNDLIKPAKRVNPSLSISELLLIQEFRNQDDQLPEIVYNGLLSVPKTAKAHEPRIEGYYKAVLGKALAKYSDTWKICNQYLPKGTPLELPSYQAHESDKVMTFSAEQGKTIARLMSQMRSPWFLLRLAFIKYKRRLGRFRKMAIKR